MAKIIAIALRKGGVGKTTTAQHLGHALAMKGQRTLLIDLDAQGSLSNLYDLTSAKGTMADLFDQDGYALPDEVRGMIVETHEPNLSIIPANDHLASADARLARNVQGPFAIDDLVRGQRLPFDYIIMDCAPGRSALLTAALVAADEIIIPVQLSPMGFHGFGAIDEMVMEARQLQRRTADGLRLRLRAVVPTFHTPGEVVSDAFLRALINAEHPDYEGEPLPVTTPVPDTTGFEKASAPVVFETANGSVRHARTIWDMGSSGDGSPVDRGQQAYLELADWVIEGR